MKIFTYPIPCQKVALKELNVVPLINTGYRPNAIKQVGNLPLFHLFVLRLFTKTALLFALMVGSNLWAQDNPKWEVGTDLLWLVGKNTLPNYSILVRHKLSDQNVLRMRLGVSSTETRSSLPRLNDERSLLLRLGYERNKALTDDLFIYFGGDASYQYNKGYLKNPAQEYPPYFSSLYVFNQFENSVRLVDNQFGLVAFIGLKYHLTDHLSFSIEPSLSFTTQRRRIYVSQFQPRELWRSLSSWDIKLAPISVLNFSFHF